MNDDLLHILFKKQIPEYVRTTYPLFVDFLKAYQEFLEQTQSQQLEQYRDVDTVTDEFVERFKAELAYNIPLDDLQDKRMFLKNLRQFYLSRGSEASYKFIFKTFFNKDVEIMYPSKQMLRASDGKWKQDVSIFVKNTSTANDLFALSGNYITIKSGGKTLVSYVENVVQYSSDIFEVFIQRDIVKSIVVGATISFTEGTINYTGNILLTPKSIKVLNPGKGFKVGDVFNLRTNLGDGCKIKVTQVDGNGGIVKAKILKFALDYTANFWSYLYAGDNAQLPPIEYFEVGGSKTLNVNDFASNNFKEYGYASKQTYMFYDETIPIGETASGASRFFADTNYVGDVYTQIYADNYIDVNLSDFAKILVEVGACSIYSGYYLSQDGFISDEIYIQDSNYYQAFSYVIKVEEELRKYADLVKTILHPAGMKMFAEFSVFNKINISATTVTKNRVIQISDILSGLIERGIGYTAYDITYDENGDFIHTPKSGAGIVLSESGKLSYILGKKINSSFPISTTAIEKLFTKVVDTSYTVDVSVAKDVVKNIAGLINNTVTVQKDINKELQSAINNISSAQKDFAKNGIDDSYAVASSAVKDFIKAVQTTITNSSLIQKDFTKIASTNVTAALTTLENTLIKGISSSSPISSLSFITLERTVSSSISGLLSSISLGLNKTIEDQYSLNSVVTDKPFVKGLSTDITILDPLAINLDRSTITDSITLLEDFVYSIVNAIRDVSSSFVVSDEYVSSITKEIADVASLLEVIAKQLDRIFTSEVSVTDASTLDTAKPISSSMTLNEDILYIRTKEISDTVLQSVVVNKDSTSAFSSTLTIVDAQIVDTSKPVSSLISASSSINTTPAKILASSTSISSTSISDTTIKEVSSGTSVEDLGSLKLNSYDSDNYFYPNAVDYQSDIVSIT